MYHNCKSKMLIYFKVTGVYTIFQSCSISVTVLKSRADWEFGNAFTHCIPYAYLFSC